MSRKVSGLDAVRGVAIALASCATRFPADIWVGDRVAAMALAIVEDEIRELVCRRGIHPIAEPEVVARLIDGVVGAYRDRTITSGQPPTGDVPGASRAFLDAVAGFGPLPPLLDNDSIE